MGTIDPTAEGDRYVALHESPRFRALRRQSNTFTAWTGGVFYGWWFLVILLAAFAPDFFREKLIGPMNVGLLFVFLSLNLVVVVSSAYLRFARTRLDPLTERVRADLEGELR
ncbi:DUF485 domain-containing protein [Streptomyces carminius]|uniref:DUF485 domain-containing protein n=1 Tax=Streptomyces carminius TaxID=2665496 RepID=A0A2M8LVI8_9ACTN|nr:DUF485 domain-containing protein [Streptomyces carminius]PJE95966.1 DUF485 domain-containing protein [Streptomyces carminius]